MALEFIYSWITDACRKNRFGSLLRSQYGMVTSHMHHPRVPQINLCKYLVYGRCRSKHDLPHPIISLFFFRTLEHPRSPNKLPITTKIPHNPPAVHFHSRRRKQVRLSIDIRDIVELSFYHIHMFMDHCPSQHPGTRGFSVDSS